MTDWRDRASCLRFPEADWVADQPDPDCLQVCVRCPVMADCARQALRLAADRSARLVGIWAGVHLGWSHRADAIARLERIVADGEAVAA